MSKKIIPNQYKGAQSATSYTVNTSSYTAGEQLYAKAKANLLNVNNWQKLAGPSTAEFSVIDDNGKETGEQVKEGNYLRIAIPAVPGSPAGKGYDWVKVEEIEETQSPGHAYIAMRVRPTVPPFYNKDEVAHFFSPNATSTFCILRRGKRIKAIVYGRNETPNTQVRNFFEKLRNIFIAIGAMIGLNKPQWKSLVKGLLDSR